MEVIYTNWKGVKAKRNILPFFIYYGSNQWHKEKQWLVKVWDLDKKAFRTYTLKDMEFGKNASNKN
jgi:hypothetical protein